MKYYIYEYGSTEKQYDELSVAELEVLCREEGNEILNAEDFISKLNSGNLDSEECHTIAATETMVYVLVDVDVHLSDNAITSSTKTVVAESLKEGLELHGLGGLECTYYETVTAEDMPKFFNECEGAGDVYHMFGVKIIELE